MKLRHSKISKQYYMESMSFQDMVTLYWAVEHNLSLRDVREKMYQVLHDSLDELSISAEYGYDRETFLSNIGIVKRNTKVD